MSVIYPYLEHSSQAILRSIKYSDLTSSGLAFLEPKLERIYRIYQTYQAVGTSKQVIRSSAISQICPTCTGYLQYSFPKTILNYNEMRPVLCTAFRTDNTHYIFTVVVFLELVILLCSITHQV